MIPHTMAGFDLTKWQSWVIPAVGLLSAGLVLVVSKLMSRSQAKVAEVKEQATVDPFTLGSASERRNYPRRDGQPLRVQLTDARGEMPPIDAWVMDRSMGGLRLSSDRSLPQNSVWSARAAGANETVPWVQVRVKRCKQDGKGYEIGLQFVKIPSWGVLLQFG